MDIDDGGAHAPVPQQLLNSPDVACLSKRWISGRMAPFSKPGPAAASQRPARSSPRGSPAEVQGGAHRPMPRSEACRRRRLEAPEELEVLVKLDLSRCLGLPQRRHITGRGREVAVERQEVSGAA